MSSHDPPAPLSLTPTVMSKMKAAKVFKTAVEPSAPLSPGHSGRSPQAQQGPRHITGLSFDDRGDQVITAGEDETFRLYNCKTGKRVLFVLRTLLAWTNAPSSPRRPYSCYRQIKILYSKKYGVDLPRFTHKNSAIVYASTKEDDTIRYHALHDNKYLQYFKGHKDRVISLEMSPTDDGFMSGSLDKTVRVWDLRSPSCRGILNLPASPVVAYDQNGVVFAVGMNQYSRILLYDISNFDKAPFLIITLEDPSLARITYPPRAIFMTSLSFSTNGKYILVGCSGDAHYIVDSFTGYLVAKLEGHKGLERRRLDAQITIEPTKGCSGEEVSWTPDSKFIVSGSLDGRICVWDVSNLPPQENPKAEVKPMLPTMVLEGHPGPARCVKFNPRLAMLASAGAELAFWLPDTSGEPGDLAKELLKKPS
ncbi:WD40 repeat-like protein [Epithele typhae]|uniref:WD40 repeat-like protein n=1 Tax=Epithele typhae TaxID=378194 RepID=UPI002008A25A|nr:WD40 repeat-like protein [Epithele typhae]KAH9945293.1 WD40 repeat-like protein [Epithele typhae]